MANYKKFGPVEGYTLWIKPDHWWRSWWFHLVGNDIEFPFIIQCSNDEEKHFIYGWSLIRWDGQKQHIVAEGKEYLLCSKGKTKLKIRTPAIYIAGKHMLQITYRVDKVKAMTAGRTYNPMMADFRILDKDDIKLQIYQILISTVVGAVVGALVTLAIIGK